MKADFKDLSIADLSAMEIEFKDKWECFWMEANTDNKADSEMFSEWADEYAEKLNLVQKAKESRFEKIFSE